MNLFNGLGTFAMLLNSRNSNNVIINTNCDNDELVNLSVYSNEVQDVEVGSAVQFPVIEIKNNITYDTTTGKITILKSGDYSIIYFVNSLQGVSEAGGQITLFKNGSVLSPAGTFPVSGGGLYSLVANDVIELINTGTQTITTNITNGSEASAPTKIIINKIS